jgi:hypothetical protein
MTDFQILINSPPGLCVSVQCRGLQRSSPSLFFQAISKQHVRLQSQSVPFEAEHHVHSTCITLLHLSRQVGTLDDSCTQSGNLGSHLIFKNLKFSQESTNSLFFNSLSLTLRKHPICLDTESQSWLKHSRVVREYLHSSIILCFCKPTSVLFGLIANVRGAHPCRSPTG